MCGRIGRFSKAAIDLIEEIGLDEFYQRFFLINAPTVGKFSYNVAPTEKLAYIRNKAGVNEAHEGRWGLEPHWAKSPDKAMGLWHLARSEGAADKPAFRDALRTSRCVVPVDGFYEWQKLEDGKTKQPWYFYRADKQPVLLAGIYARHSWGDSFAILTTPANTLMANIHERMPVIVSPEDSARWLAPDVTDPSLVEDLMRACPSEWLETHMVSSAVGNVRNDYAELIEPLEAKAS